MAVTKLQQLLREDQRPQYVIAAELGVSPGRLSQYANGMRSIPLNRVYSICEYFNVDPQELLGRS